MTPPCANRRAARPGHRRRSALAPPVDSIEPVAPVAPVEPPPVTAAAPAPQPSAQEEPPPPAEEEHPTPSEQAISLRELLYHVGKQLTGLAAVPEPLATYLEENGITAAYLSAIGSLHSVLESGLATRQQAMSDEDVAVRQLECPLHGPNRIRHLSPDGAFALAPEYHGALGLTSPMPARLGIFIGTARESLAAAQREPYAGLLAIAAFGAERVQAVATLIDVLQTLLDARNAAHLAGLAATRARNESARELRRAARQLTVEVNSILRLHPEVNRPDGF
ncbi:MAG: hypothetical protein M9936_27195 [Caldilinea sp.]|nr:hypothetical protein [Caldilinea sp.]